MGVPFIPLEGEARMLQRVLQIINTAMKHLLNLIMVVLVVSTFMQVVFRFVIKNPLAWTEELSRYCLIWLTFLGAAYAMSKKAHIMVEFFINLFPPVGRKIIISLAAIINLVFFYILIFYGLQLVQSSMSQLSPVLRIPMGVIYLAIPIGGFFLAVNLIPNLIRDIRKGDEK